MGFTKELIGWFLILVGLNGGCASHSQQADWGTPLPAKWRKQRNKSKTLKSSTDLDPKTLDLKLKIQHQQRKPVKEERIK